MSHEAPSLMSSAYTICSDEEQRVICRLLEPPLFRHQRRRRKAVCAARTYGARPPLRKRAPQLEVCLVRWACRVCCRKTRPHRHLQWIDPAPVRWLQTTTSQTIQKKMEREGAPERNIRTQRAHATPKTRITVNPAHSAGYNGTIILTDRIQNT